MRHAQPPASPLGRNPAWSRFGDSSVATRATLAYNGGPPRTFALRIQRGPARADTRLARR